jgi:NTP pyrophosphatase (non-canonical NTP hydrolase)
MTNFASNETAANFLSPEKAAGDTNVEAFQAKVHQWIKVNGGYWKPMEMVGKLTEEAGEISREMLRRHGPKKKESVDPNNLKLEIADALFALTCIANTHNISLDDALKSVMEKYNIRDAGRWTETSQK